MRCLEQTSWTTHFKNTFTLNVMNVCEGHTWHHSVQVIQLIFVQYRNCLVDKMSLSVSLSLSLCLSLSLLLSVTPPSLSLSPATLLFLMGIIWKQPYHGQLEYVVWGNIKHHDFTYFRNIYFLDETYLSFRGSFMVVSWSIERKVILEHMIYFYMMMPCVWLEALIYRSVVLSHAVMPNSVTLWSVAQQAPLSVGILQAGILAWVSIPSSRGSSQPRDQARSPASQADAFHLSHQGKPRILEWVAYPFSRVISQPRNWTRVSCIAGGFFTSWTTREAHIQTACILTS